ncbi:MAG TPA: hypothetical protein VFJ82_19015 [Longimicrobium sp.]|nr:hypothetical protein [Longimicrobium sp.]
MALRHFKDTEGHEWRVWDVFPFGGRHAERRNADRRVAASNDYTGPERRSGRQRRVRTPTLLTPGLESGWLCFENHVDKRRLTPVPVGWDEAPVEELEGLLGRARSVQRRHGQELQVADVMD